MSAEPAQRKASATSPGVNEAVSWELADEATRTLSLRTLEVLDTREVVAKLALRYTNSDNPHRAGHLFEVMHALSFNEDAILQQRTVRADVTEWAEGGSQTAAADVSFVQGQDIIGEAQAKLYESVSTTAHELAREHYDGMQRLVAEDKLADVQALLDRKITMNPEGINTEHFRDAHSQITDTLRQGSVASDPVSYDDAQRAATDPNEWIDDEAREAAGE